MAALVQDRQSKLANFLMNATVFIECLAQQSMKLFYQIVSSSLRAY